MNTPPIPYESYKNFEMIFKTFSSNPKFAGNELLTPDLIPMTLEMLEEHHAKACIENGSMLLYELFLAKLFISAITLISMGVYSEDNPHLLFPLDWLASEGRPNANQIFSHLLLQLSHNAYSTAILCEAGLDNPARSQCRVASDCAHQTLILIGSRDDFKHWIKGHDPESSTKIWNELFSRGKWNKKLVEIEKSIAPDQAISEELKLYRKENYEVFSMATHGSFVATVAGIYAQENSENDPLKINLFGTKNFTIKGTMDQLLYSLWYFSILLQGILFKLHKFRLPKVPQKFFIEGLALLECAQKDYLRAESKNSQ